MSVYRKILVPLDGSATSLRGLAEAIRLAADQKASLVLLNVVDDFGMLLEMSGTASQEKLVEGMRQYGQDVMAKAVAEARAANVPAETLQRQAIDRRVAEVISEEVVKSGCDLVVMGTHGRRGFSRLAMGSDAEQVARMSHVPVLLARSEHAS